ncbi:MAG: hypothetical protein OXB95_10500, partial [Rhodobacteraceae bacterium]|nr:hypothetical protein [Paracoccaceae bacterium]
MRQRTPQRQRQARDRLRVPGALVDASVLLADPGVIMRLQDKTFPVISTTLRQDLEATTKRGSNKPQSENAAKIYRLLDREEPRIVATLPNGMAPRDNDRFLRFDLGWAE